MNETKLLVRLMIVLFLLAVGIGLYANHLEDQADNERYGISQ